MKHKHNVLCEVDTRLQWVVFRLVNRITCIRF